MKRLLLFMSMALAIFAFAPNTASASSSIRPAHGDECEESFTMNDDDDDCPPPAPVVSGSVKAECVEGDTVLEIVIDSDTVGFAVINTDAYGDENLGDVGVGSNTFHLQVDPGTYMVTVTVLIDSNGYNVVESASVEVDSCTPPPPTDVCPNLDGNQSEVPAGMVKDDAGNCVTPPPPPVDVCPNIDGNQSEVPAGMVVNDAGNCVKPLPVTGLKTNITYMASVITIGGLGLYGASRLRRRPLTNR